MKFETLKHNCASWFYNHNGEDFWTACAIESLRVMKEEVRLNKYREISDKLKNDGWEAIMRTDIRNVKALSDTFPSIVPNWIKNGHYVPELTDNGWELINVKQPNHSPFINVQF